MALSSMSGNHSGVVNPVAVTNAHPPCKTALAAQTLLQHVQINVDEDSEENGDKFEDEKEPDKGFNDDLHCGSDIEIGNITFEPASEPTTMAPPNKKSAATSTSHGLKRTLQVPPDPPANNLTDEDEDEDGEFSFVLVSILCSQ